MTLSPATEGKEAASRPLTDLLDPVAVLEWSISLLLEEVDSDGFLQAVDVVQEVRDLPATFTSTHQGHLLGVLYQLRSMLAEVPLTPCSSRGSPLRRHFNSSGDNSRMGCNLSNHVTSDVQSETGSQVTDERCRFEQGVSSPTYSARIGAMLSSSLTKATNEENEPSAKAETGEAGGTPKDQSEKLHPILRISVEDDTGEELDELTPFSVNRLISCPDLTPTVERAKAVENQQLRSFSAKHARLLHQSFSNDEYINWAEHSPITPRSSLVSYQM
jgi:hypothetical protein